MRTKSAPEKSDVRVPKPPKVSLCVVTHATRHPYYENKIDILRLSLSTMIEGAKEQNTELLIWDNGSTPEVREFLKTFKPTVFVESINLGAHDARHCLAHMARGEYLSMADDDIFYFPNWIEKQIEVLEAYPKVGSVSGSPIKGSFKSANNSVRLFMANDKDVRAKVGKLLPDEYLYDYAVSVGWKEPEIYVQRCNDESKRNRGDILLTYKGVKAWGHGHHMQLTARTKIIKGFFPRNEFMINGHQNMNSLPDKAGYLNLTTYDRTAIHIGNEIDKTIVKLFRQEWNNSAIRDIM